MAHGEIVERLRRHYKENVLEPEPDPKFDELKKRLENPETFAETVAKRLNAYYWKSEEIKKSDLDGSRPAKIDAGLSMAVIKVPEDKIPALFKKMRFPEQAAAAAAINKNSCGINIVLLPDNKASGIAGKHEEAHILRAETCRPYGEIMRFLSANTGRDGTWFKCLSLKEELDMLDEILAYGTQWDDATDEELSSYFRESAQRKAETMGGSGALPDCGIIGRHKAQKIVEEKIVGYISKRIRDKEVVMAGNRFYAADFAQSVGDAHLGSENGILPDGGVVSRHRAKTILENATCEYFKKRFDDGQGAFKILYKNLPFEKVSRIVRSCESADELVEWSKHYEEVLGNGA